MMLVGLCILNHETSKTAKKKMSAHLEAVLDCGYRADLLVDACILVENKTVDGIHPVHRAQLLTYLKLSGCSIGFLLNAHQAWNPAHDLAKTITIKPINRIFFAVFVVFAVQFLMRLLIRSSQVLKALSCGDEDGGRIRHEDRFFTT